MNKKLILSIVAVVLCIAIAVGGVLIAKNQQEEEIPEVEFPTNVIEETTGEAVTEETTEKTTEKATEITTEKVTGKETVAQNNKPDAKKNNYEIIYNKQGQISQFKIDIAGKFDSSKIKEGESLQVDVSVNYAELGDTEEHGKYLAETWEGSSWYLDLNTKQGCREEYSCASVEYEDGSCVNADGFPTRKEPYDNAVELEFKDDCVTIIVKLDKPIDIKGKNFDVNICIDGNAFVTIDGYSNENWEVWYNKQVPQPEKDFVPGSFGVVEAETEEYMEIETVIPNACQ